MAERAEADPVKEEDRDPVQNCRQDPEPRVEVQAEVQCRMQRVSRGGDPKVKEKRRTAAGAVAVVKPIQAGEVSAAEPMISKSSSSRVQQWCRICGSMAAYARRGIRGEELRVNPVSR